LEKINRLASEKSQRSKIKLTARPHMVKNALFLHGMPIDSSSNYKLQSAYDVSANIFVRSVTFLIFVI